MGLVLCADIGNTNTVLGLVDGREVRRHWRLASDEHRTADEWAMLIKGLLRAVHEDVEGIAICATVPAVMHAWREMLHHYFTDVPSIIVEPGVRTGIPLRMDNPREVGADRIVNSLAAVTLYGGPAIVVDFGTATTFDVVDASGAYVGGAISAGIGISLEALGRRGAQLRKVEIVRPRSVIAKNTVEAMQSGLVFGFAAQVDGIVTRMKAELGVDEIPVIATGGLATLVINDCETVTDHQPWLTLMGLAMVFERNSG